MQQVDPDDVSGTPLPDELDERPQRRREWSGAFRSVGFPLLLVALIISGVWYFENARPGSAVKTPSGQGVIALDAARNHTGQAAAPVKGRAAPDFRLTTLDGRTVRLSDLQGKMVLVNFWASWCVECRQEMPEIIKAYGQYHDRGFEVVAVDEQEDATTVRKWVEAYGMQFPVALDTTSQVGQTYRAEKQLPTSFFVDQNGQVTDIHLGPMSLEFIQQKLATLQ
jgi:peroxiredoxin